MGRLGRGQRSGVVVTCCCHRLTQERARAIHRHETNLQKYWEGRKQAAERQGVPFDEPYPEYSVPPPFSPEWYHLPGNEKR